MKAKASLVLTGLFLLFGCGGERSANTLAVFNWTDYIGANTIASFEKTSGAKVSYDNYSSNEDLIAKLQTGGAAYDVVFPSAYAVEILLAKQMLLPLDQALIPNRSNLLPEFSSPEFDRELKYCVPYTWSVTAIAYDPAEVTEEAAKSAAVLFNPQFKGKILMLDDMRATLGIALKLLGYSANSTNETEITKAREKLVEQKQLVHVYASSNLPQLLASGEVKLAYAWSGDILQAVQMNPKLRMSIPREGSLMYVDYMCVPRIAKNPALANRFINHILDPAITADIAQTIKYAMPNAKAQGLVNPETRKLWDQMKYAEDRTKLEPVRNVGSALQFYDQAWQAVKSAP
jgi:spermidine/putrescine transport system substrate-binding protein